MPSKKTIPPTPKPSRWLTALGLLAIVLPVGFPLFTFRLPSGHDTFSYHPRLVEFHENIVNGNVLPRWAPDLQFGAGQPLFLFSPPLPYYAAEFWHLLGFDTVVSFNIVAIVTILTSAWAMFLFAGYQFGRRAGWLAAAAYVYAPYFHVDIYVRHAFAELMTFPLYPLALYGFSRYMHEAKPRYLALGASAWAAIMLTHNPSALLFAPVLLGFLIFLGIKARTIRLTVTALSGFLMGIGLATLVWLPALSESQFVYIERSLQGDTKYADHFVFPQQLLSPIWGYGSSVPGPLDQMSFSLGWGHLLLTAAAAWQIYRGNIRTLRIWFILAGAGLLSLAVMMTGLSSWLWSNLPLLSQVQFPWRLLANSVVLTAIMAALYGASINDTRYSQVCFWAGMGLLILPNLSHIGPREYYPIVPSEWTPGAIAQQGIETTAGSEFEPRWVKERTPYTSDRVLVISGSAEISKIERSPTSWRFESRAQTGSMIEAVLLYFPGWTVYVDGTSVATQIAETGRIRFLVPAGVHQVSIQFRRTTIRIASELISAAAFLIVMGLAFYAPLKSRRK